MDTALMDKLRLLGLDTILRPQIKMKRMSRFYFSVPSSPSEQLFAFVSIAVWLARRSGADLEQPREEDDPNSTIAGIAEVLRSRGLTLDFSPHKLKQGYGEQVQLILNKLADDVMQAEDIGWRKPVVTAPSEDTTDDDQVEDETEVMVDLQDEDMEVYSEDSDDAVGYPSSGPVEGATEHNRPQHDQEQWRLELERVAPALRVKVTADGLDWRSRHAQMKAYRDELVSRYAQQGARLQQTRAGVAACLEQLGAREAALNRQLAEQVREYAQCAELLSAATAENEEINSQIAEYQETLNELNSKLETVKQKTESKGSAMNDNSPLVNAKQALITLKREIQDLDFQLLVLLWLLTTKDTPQDTLNGRLALVDSY